MTRATTFDPKQLYGTDSMRPVRLQGYRDRLAHRRGQIDFRSDAEREAYEEGVQAAEQAMGFCEETTS